MQKSTSLTNINNGDMTLLIGTKNEWNETIGKYHNKGYISSNIYNKNIETINRVQVLKENISDIKSDIKVEKEEIDDSERTLHLIETDPVYKRVYGNFVDRYNERIEIATKKLADLNESLKCEVDLYHEAVKKIKEIQEESKTKLFI